MPSRVGVPAATLAPTGETAVYLLRDSLLVDPAAHTDALADLLGETDPEHVAVTHHHIDHVAAVAECARTYDLTVWARAGREEEFADATGVDPDRTFREGTVIPAGEGVPVLETPGHAPEHVAFGTPDGYVTGDLAVAEGSVVVGAPSGDMRAYLTSLRRLHARDPGRLYPGHGPVIEDPRRTCARLIAHRLDRERRVLAAVRDGARTPEAVVDAAYEKDLSGVRDLANATVRAHLQKLAREGAVRWDGETAGPA